jgi:hypothetical protein
MPDNETGRSDPIQRVMAGTLLANEGKEFDKGLWERTVYLGPDGFVYHIVVVERRGATKKSIVGKRQIGEYLRWVDGLFRPGGLPGEENGIHFRAARLLRELI